MSLPSAISKENFRLLDLSSNEESEDLQLEIIPRKKKITRRERNRSAAPSRTSEPNFGAEVRCALLWAVRVSLFIWLLALTWLCAALYDQVTTMRNDVAKVSTSSDGVGDALQLCHTAAKELRANASELSARLARLEAEHALLASKVEQANGKLAAVSQQLLAAPNRLETPASIGELQRLLADFGAQIKGYDSDIKAAHNLAATATQSIDEVHTSLHNLEARTNDTIANVSANARREDELKKQIGDVNDTLAAQIHTLQLRIDAVAAKPVAPTASSATSTTVAPGAGTTLSSKVTPAASPTAAPKEAK